MLRSYIVGLKPGKIVLWCYLLWYLVIAGMYFDPAPGIWLNALGLSGVMGLALWLGVRTPGSRVDRWQIMRLFLTPFCVASFSALIKGRGFILVFPPRAGEFLLAVGACVLFVAAVAVLKRAWAPAAREAAGGQPT